MNRHEIKTDPEAYRAVKEGRKTFEIRFDDRGYEVGDLLILRETTSSGAQMKSEGHPLIYTGNYIDCVVQYILRGPVYGLQEGWVIMSIR